MGGIVHIAVYTQHCDDAAVSDDFDSLRLRADGLDYSCSRFLHSCR